MKELPFIYCNDSSDSRKQLEWDRRMRLQLSASATRNFPVIVVVMHRYPSASLLRISR
ncbi:hypothetical protein Plhal304r1_c008g0030891 [Plasmopara halstedii]